MRKLKFIHWLFATSLVILMGCPEGNGDNTDRNGSGTGVSRPLNGIQFERIANENQYGLDVRNNSTDAYISIRQSRYDGEFKTGFGVKIDEFYVREGARAVPWTYTIVLDNSNPYCPPNKTTLVRFSSSFVGQNDIDIYGCSGGTSDNDCWTMTNSIGVITYQETILPTPKVYFLSGAYRNTSELANYFNGIIKQAVCKVNGISGGITINVPNSVWDLNGNGEFFYSEYGQNSFQALMTWCYNNNYYRQDEPTLIVLPMMMEYYGFDRMAEFRGVTLDNFAVVGSDATNRDIVHEFLHMIAFGRLQHINDADYSDNIMFHQPVIGLGATNLLYRTIPRGGGNQWNILNDM